MKKTKDLDSQPVSIRFPKGQIEHVKQIARKLSASRKEDVSYSELIRKAVEKIYPQK